MATLPRMRNSKSGISSPFSTSPRKLQEMSMPTPEANSHDVTVASGVSLKQYEEQLSGLKKENFHLKLRVYFLEEKLGNGSPPAVQGLLEHNVRLQVEVEELRRQLADKQELLAAAAEAIDVLEQQGSVSNDSIETSMNQSSNIKKNTTSADQVMVKSQELNETCAESESAGDYLAVTVNNDELDELVKLRRENRKALQMIKGCMKKIQQQDKEIKKIKLDKELVYAHVSDSQLEKYEEILKCKDEHIKDLESKIREFQKKTDNATDDNSGNLQEMLTRRLQGLAYFLDRLLSHKCVLGEDKKKLAESILEQSLALPVGLKLDESMAPGDITVDESTIDMSQSFRIEDLTMMFGHHVTCNDESRRLSRKLHKDLPKVDTISESECWSEPDRNVSLARIGLGEMAVASKEFTSDINNRQKARRSRVSYGSRSDDNNKNNEEAWLEEMSILNKQSEALELEKKNLESNLAVAEKQIQDLISEKENLKEALASERSCVTEANKNIEILNVKMLMMETRIRDVEHQLSDAVQVTDKLRAERQELETTFLETERSLRHAADEATLQASQAALERAKAQHDKLRIEKELEETRDKLCSVMEANAQFEMELTRKVAVNANNKIAVIPDGIPSEEDRPTSPDLGIDSDRLSSLEHNDDAALSPRSLYEENVTLKQKLARTKATLAETLTQLNAANIRKMNVQRAICREIHKTHGVLRKARDQLENQK